MWRLVGQLEVEDALGLAGDLHLDLAVGGAERELDFADEHDALAVAAE